MIATAIIERFSSFTIILQVIQDLESRVAAANAANAAAAAGSNPNSSSVSAGSRHRELRKLKLKYEIMARNEINQRMSEINAFLGQRAKEQEKNEKDRDQVMEKIQRELGEKLQQSKEELAVIKQQMKG